MKCDNKYLVQSNESDEAGITYYEEVANCDYNMAANAEGYLPNDVDATVDGSVNPVTVVIELQPIGPDPIVLRHIYYDFEVSASVSGVSGVTSSSTSAPSASD